MFALGIYIGRRYISIISVYVDILYSCHERCRSGYIFIPMKLKTHLDVNNSESITPLGGFHLLSFCLPDICQSK